MVGLWNFKRKFVHDLGKYNYYGVVAYIISIYLKIQKTLKCTVIFSVLKIGVIFDNI